MQLLILTLFCLINNVYMYYYLGRDDGKIVNGIEADISQFPYQVALLPQKCGGSIISKTYIVTAAHCFPKYFMDRFDSLHIRAASSKKDIGGQVIYIKDVIIHEHYDTPIRNDNDIALVILKEKIKFSYKAMPIKFYFNDLPVGQWANVSGFGHDRFHGEFTDRLNYISVQILSNERCRGYYSGKFKITYNMFCAGFLNGEGDSCQGDSGGPIVANGKLVGIVSFGFGCAEKGYPGVYTNIARMKEWLNRHLNFY